MEKQSLIKLKGVPEPSLLILLLLVSFPSVGAVLFTPALPAIAQAYGISSGLAQLTITIFLIGYALGQLPYGPLSNRVGRKKALYLGLAISIVGALLSLAAGALEQYWLLALSRMIAALGASVGLMMTFTITNDYYEPQLARQKLAFVNVAFAIAPGAAVTLGGFATQYFGWESTFLLQAVYSVLIFMLCLKLPETGTELSPEPLNWKVLYESYAKRCKNPRLFVCGVLQGCCTALVYIFAAKAPFLAIHMLGLSPSTYGALNLIPSVGMILGAVLSHRTAHMITPQKGILLGLCLIFPSALAMFLAFYWEVFNMWTLFGPYFVMNMGIVFAYINCPTLGTGHAKNKPNASAVFAFLNITMCVITVFALQALDSPSPILMPVLFLSVFVVIFPLYGILEFLLKRTQ
ncbi:MAG: MFS transporter [Verrucomicrobia bacterium]|nr:MFS transporter [Verrucomicrobiota bacterium]